MWYSISGPSPGREVGRERGWGLPGRAGQQHLEWGVQQRGEQRGGWSGELRLQRQGGGGGLWVGTRERNCFLFKSYYISFIAEAEGRSSRHEK